MHSSEKDLLWDELNLGGLVHSMHNPYGMSDQDSIDRINKSKILKKHNDIVQKPTYTAIMGRYDALPHKPVSINSKKLDMLSDPIKGRFSRFDKLMEEDDTKYQINIKAGASLSPAKRSMRLNNQDSSISPVKSKNVSGNAPSGFFLTGGDDNGEPDNADQDIAPAPRHGRSRNGLAAALRGRVSEAQRNIQQKDPMIQNKQKWAKKIGQAKNSSNRGVVPSRRVAPKKEWTDNKHVDYVGKRSGRMGVDVNARVQGAQPVGGPRNKVAGSGYGYKVAADKGIPQKAGLPKVTANGRHTRLLKKLTGNTIDSATELNYDSSAGRERRAVPLARRAPPLRSKSTIDLPDRIAESDTDNETVAQRRRQKTGVRSAPAQMNRSKSSVPRRGPTDSDGNVITLDGLAKVSRKPGLLRPLPEVRPRKVRGKSDIEATTKHNQPLAKAGIPMYPSQAHQMMQNMMAGMGMGGPTQSAQSQLSAEAAQVAQIALARAYRQQTDPLFAQQQQIQQHQQEQQQQQLMQQHFMQQQQQMMMMQQHNQQQQQFGQNLNIYPLPAEASNPNPSAHSYINHHQPSHGALSHPQASPSRVPMPGSPTRLMPPQQQQNFGAAEEDSYQIKPQDYSFLNSSLESQARAPPALTGPGRTRSESGEAESGDDDPNDEGNEREEEESSEGSAPAELDAEEQLVDDLVNMDIETALQRLQKFQSSAKQSGIDIDGSALSYTKPGAVATFTKHVKSLSSNLNAAESYLASYRNLAEGGYGGSSSYGIKGELA